MENTKPDATTSVKSWVNLYSDFLYSLAYYKTSNKEVAEDLVQETFLAAFKAFEKFENRSAPKTWLTSILSNKIAEHFRKAYKTNSKNTVSIDHFFDNTDSWIADQRPSEWQLNEEGNLLDNLSFKKILSDCLDKLPEKWKSSIIMKFVDEKSGEKVCQELELSPTNYWQILHRSKLHLRKCIELNWFNK